MNDAFNGLWEFAPGASRLTSPSPREWTQRIAIAGADVRVIEDIVFADGKRATVTVKARLDGTDYPVDGSPVADAIAYTRINARCVAAAAKLRGRPTFEETVVVSDDGQTLTVTLSFATQTGERTSSVAVFTRSLTGSSASDAPYDEAL
jgi:hypothetical protein